MAGRELLEFGPYRFDPARLVLWRGDQLVPVPLKDLETLLVLLEHPGEVVSKDELLQNVWPGTFIEEANVARHVSNLRALLAEDSGSLTFIETIPKRGYRFVAPVCKVMLTTEAQHADAPQSSRLDDHPTPLDGGARTRRRSLLIRASLSVLAALLLLLGSVRLLRPRQETRASVDRIMLA